MPVEITPIERALPFLAGAALAGPVLIAKFPPMDDLPLHEASIGLLRHWTDPGFTPHGLYFINLGHSNQLFSLVALALAFALPIAWATKLAVAATLVALPLGAARFADHVKAPRWTALLAAPIGLGWLFFLGLVQNMLGIAVLLALLPSLDRFALRPTVRRALASCGAMLLLHFAHQSTQLVACVALAACSMGGRRSKRLDGLRLIPLVFSGLLGYAADRYAWHFANHAQIASVGAVYSPLSYKVLGATAVLFGGVEPPVRSLMLVLALAPVTLFFIERMKRRKTPEGASWAARMRPWRFEILVALLLFLYLVFPAHIKVTTFVYHRFLPPAWAIGVVSSGAGTRRTSGLAARALCAALPVASLLVVWPTFVDSDRVYRDLERLMVYMAPASSVLSTSTGALADGRLWNPATLDGYVVAEHGGRSVNDYTQSPLSILAQRPEKQWVEPHLRLRKRHFDLRPAWDMRRFRYLIVEDDSPAAAMAVSKALEGAARLTATAGSLYLYESTLPLVAIDADDAPLPEPLPPTLDSLVRAAVSSRRPTENAKPPEKAP